MSEAEKPMEEESWLRQRVIDAALELERTGLSPNRSGNVSARFLSSNGGDIMLITPTGLAYHDLLPGDIVAMHFDGTIMPAQRCAPSSEWHMHAAIYKEREDAGGIVHAHSDNATALACHGRGIPAFHYMVAVTGQREIPCASYATFGTDRLASNAATALKHGKACLLAHHGQVALGSNVEEALHMAQEVEVLARQFMLARQIGKVPLLTDEEMDRNIEKFRTYGKQP